MSDEERNSYEEGDTISIVPPGINVIQKSTNAEKDLDNLNKGWTETKDRWQRTDNIGNPQPVKTDHRTSEYYQKPTDNYETEEWKRNKQRANQKDNKPKVEPILVPSKQNPYARANVWADGYGAQFSLYLEAVKWEKFNMRIVAITRFC